MLAPVQERSADHLTFITAHDVSRLRLLTILPTALSGKHIKFTKYIDCIEGKSISVEFDRPTTLQIDGETLNNVLNFSVEALTSHQSPSV